MKQALIIFVRHPESGKVKTRLAATLGNETALSIYKKLLEHTKNITLLTGTDKFVFYAEQIVEDDLWQHEHYFKLQQENSDLGSRMLAAFEQVFAQGYDKVCIIGSDCYELTSDIINHAYVVLHDHDMVLGPAEDGGYYLLGMKKVYAPIFENKSWSSDSVLTETIRSIENLALTHYRLPVLKDVDEAKDVPASLLSL